MKVTLRVVNDHPLMLKALSKMISGFSGFDILFVARNGIDLQKKMRVTRVVPDIIILDDIILSMDV